MERLLGKPTMKKKPTLKDHITYEAFLRKRLESTNFKANVSKEEYDKTKAKHDKVKLVIKLLSKS